ncbi:MAG: carboxylesterase family protein [Cellvibrionaceae bacterium]
MLSVSEFNLKISNAKMMIPLMMGLLFFAVTGCTQKETGEKELMSQTTLEENKITSADPLEKIINSGRIKGVSQKNGSYSWLGIPYAKPPVGELRWKLPQPVEPWEGTFVADNPNHPCPQFASTVSRWLSDDDGDGLLGEEDCLYLSVYAPSSIKDSNKKLPVMYWIFGGGNNSGYSGSYNGSILAEDQQVIVVAIDYRLGTLGWLIHPAILDEGASGAAASGNWSTVDTIHGLKWVQENIEVFGGDKNNVTIFGESAGGANVMSLVTSPIAKGLFHRAIVESGGVSTTSIAQGQNFIDDEAKGHRNSSREIINKILIRDGKASNRDDAKAIQLAMSNNEIKELLYRQSATSFLRLYNPSGARNYPAPKKFADGTVFVKEPPLKQLASGQYNQVPMILGTNRDERRIYLFRDPKWTQVIKENPGDYIRAAKYPSDLWKLRAVDGLARIMAPVQDDQIFTYRFDWDEEAVTEGSDLATAIGAGHSVEMAFVFGDWDVGFVPADVMYDPKNLDSRIKLSKSMMAYWGSFAYTGKPGKGTLDDQVEWQAWENGEGKPKMIILDTDADGGIRMSEEEMTKETVKAEFLSEDFSDQKLQCDIYKSTFTVLGNFDEAEYQSLGDGSCL